MTKRNFLDFEIENYLEIGICFLVIVHSTQ